MLPLASLCVWACDRGNVDLHKCIACDGLFHHQCAGARGQDGDAGELCGRWVSLPACRAGAQVLPDGPGAPPPTALLAPAAASALAAAANDASGAEKRASADVVDLSGEESAPAKKTKPNMLKILWLQSQQPGPVARALEALPSPLLSELERARVVEVKAPAKPKKEHAAHATASKNMAATRLTEPEFQGQSLVLNVSNRQELWCKGCRKVVQSKKSIVQTHTAADSHKKARWLKRAKARTLRCIAARPAYSSLALLRPRSRTRSKR